MKRSESASLSLANSIGVIPFGLSLLAFAACSGSGGGSVGGVNTNSRGDSVVLKTDPDRSVAQVDDKSQRGLIKVQDRVATKLSRTGTS